MAKGQMRSNKEKKKPKKEVAKTVAAAPSTKQQWQPGKPADDSKKK